MGQEIYWIYAFNIIVNSTLSFFTTIAFVDVIIRLLRIKHPRVKAICYLLPFCKICIDLCLYQFSNWALLHGVNPILAETGTRNLSIMAIPFTGIHFSMQDGKSFSIADILALSTDIKVIQAIVSIAIAGTIIACTSHLIRILQAKRSIDLMLQNAILINWPNLKSCLAKWIKEKGVQLALTSTVNSPCITNKTILFPDQLLNDLSQEEVEAIIAHEISHLHYRDSSLRLAYSIIATLFCWIPTKWLQRRIEEMQEQASDFMIHRFGISRFALAEAILKTARNAKGISPKIKCSFLGHRQSLKNRMGTILQEPMQRSLKWETIQYGLLGLSLLSILLGKLWIF